MRYDVAVIGAGPGGYVCAIRSAQLGLKTVCVDERMDEAGKAALGGTCLNVGCIPSKALLESSENYEKAREEFSSHGITFGEIGFDVGAMQARKKRIVDSHTSGIAFLFKKNKVDSMLGRARIEATGEFYRISVSGGQQIEAKHVVIATGSSPRQISAAPLGGRIVDSTGALSFQSVPDRLCIIGAGVIGLELGSVWRRLGSDVTILEAMPDFLPMADGKISKEALRLFRKNKDWSIRLGVEIISAESSAESVKVVSRDAKGESREEYDHLVVAAGRVPNSSGIFEGLGIDSRGFIEVDECCRTNLPRVYAIGDVVRGPMLAHKASEEGVMVAEIISGMKSGFDRDIVPSVIYTFPEIAWVGKTEEELKSAGIEYRAGQFPFTANGRAQAMGAAQGFVKMLGDAKTDRILGVHIIGPHASELVSEAVVAMAFSASSEDIASIIHAHPSLSEVMHEAALSVDGRAMHI